MRICKTVIIVLGVISLAWQAWAGAVPAEVLLIRHGEKPPKGNNLNVRGMQRAQALVPLFANMPFYSSNTGGTTAVYGVPVAIYARGQKKATSSARPIETVTPLAKQLGVSINHAIDTDTFSPKNAKKYAHMYYDLVNEILGNPAYNGQKVLICWEHDAIPTIAQAFLDKAGGASLPKALVSPKNFVKFDRIYRIHFNQHTKQATKIENLAQALLYGDSSPSTSVYYHLKI